MTPWMTFPRVGQAGRHALQRQLWFRSAGITCWSLIAMLAFTGSAAAQACSVSMSELAFGTVALRQSGSGSSTAAVSVSCVGLPNQTVRVCPSVASTNAGGRAGGQLTAIGNTNGHVEVALFDDPMYSMPWHSGIDVALDGRGNGTARQTIYGRIYANPGVKSAGQYRAPLAVSYTISYLGLGPLCGGAPAAHVIRR